MKRAAFKSLFLLLSLSLAACAHKPAEQTPALPAVSEAPAADWNTNGVARAGLDEHFRQALRLGSLSPFDVSLDGSKRHPVLEGVVATSEQKAALENVVLAFKGVQTVTNHLRVVPAPLPPAPAAPGASAGTLVALSVLSLLAVALLIALLRARRQLARLRAEKAPAVSAPSQLRSLPKVS